MLDHVAVMADLLQFAHQIEKSEQRQESEQRKQHRTDDFAGEITFKNGHERAPFLNAIAQRKWAQSKSG